MKYVNPFINISNEESLLLAMFSKSVIDSCPVSFLSEAKELLEPWVEIYMSGFLEEWSSPLNKIR